MCVVYWYSFGNLYTGYLNKTKGDPKRPCLELQDALSIQLPPEIHLKMLSASRTIALRQTSRTMRTAVEKAGERGVEAQCLCQRPPSALS